ncbi:hypothetical protein [Bacillus paranthracis]|uniref:hypothetical protein n=1 Tax=Bacillus paranthracis TaxID=2026186 RepID=UPI001E386B11|nr:hypothetical protein [Bacillus paranthracis]MCC2436206.1 hypothetical protein [Bacillus paranthracis]
MREKIYSIASSSLCNHEKSHTVVIGSGPNRNEVTYSFSITAANTSDKDDISYPLSIAPYARHKAVKEDTAGSIATKIRKKAILSDVIEEALRRVEIDTITHELTDSTRMNTINTEVEEYCDAVQYERIFDTNHIEGVNGNRIVQQSIFIQDNDTIMDLKEKEYTVSQITENVELKKKLYELAAETSELPTWTKVARVLYGEEFYAEITGDKAIREFGISDINITKGTAIEKEFTVEHNHLSSSSITPKLLPTILITDDITEVKEKELQINLNYYCESLKLDNEIQITVEKFDLFEGMGIPVYLPEFDLFSKVQKDLLVNMVKPYQGSCMEHVRDTLLHTEIKSTKTPNIINVVHTDMHTGKKDNEFIIDTVSLNHSKRKHLLLTTNDNGMSGPYLSSRKEKEIKSINHNEEIICKKEKTIRTNIANYQDSSNADIFNNAIVIEHDEYSKLREIDSVTVVHEESVKVEKIISVAESILSKSKRVSQKLDTILSNHELFNVDNEKESVVISNYDSNRKINNVFTRVIESVQYNINKYELVTDISGMTDSYKKENELNTFIESFDLFDGMGIPVYLPDFDLFRLVRKEIESRFSFITDTSKNIVEMDASEIQSIHSEKICNQHTMDITSESISKVPIKTIETIDTNEDVFTKENTQDLIIDNIESFEKDKYYSLINSEQIESKHSLILKELSVFESDLYNRKDTVNALIEKDELTIRTDTKDASIKDIDDGNRLPNKETMLQKDDEMTLERILDTEKPEEVEEIYMEHNDPKLWLRHSRQSWWSNSKWNKTR